MGNYGAVAIRDVINKPYGIGSAENFFIAFGEVCGDDFAAAPVNAPVFELILPKREPCAVKTG